MNEKALKALKKSIIHWKLMSELSPKGKTPYEENCALCLAFRVQENWWSCEGCPVKEETGQSLCSGSPYEKAFNAWRQWKNADREPNFATDEWVKCAIEELDFLKSLLPEKKLTKKKSRRHSIWQ